MVVYLVIYILFFAFSIMHFKLDDKFKNILFNATSLLLILFVSLKFENSPDWFYYKSEFAIVDWQYLLNNNVEPLFVLLCMLVKAAGGDFYIVSILIGIVSLGLKINFIKKYALVPMWSLFYMLPFVIIFDMILIRQALAIAILLASFKYIVNRNLAYYILLVILATGFHYSAALFFPVYFIYRSKISIWFGVIVIALLTLFDFFFRFSLPSVIFEQLNDHILHKYQAYHNLNNNYAFEIKSYYWRVSIFLGVTYLLRIKENRDIRLLNNVYFCGIIVFILFASVKDLSLRGSYYFKVVEPVLIINTLIVYKGYLKKVGLLTLIVFSLFYYSRSYYNRYLLSVSRELPYKTVFHQSVKNTQ